MIAQGARLIEDGKTLFVGWGIPQVVAMLAQKLYVPNVTQLFEFGAVGPRPVLPFVRGTMGGPQNTYRSLQWLNMNWAFSFSATGYMDYGMLGALQVDPHGNINSTFLGGAFEKPQRRFAGSGGGNQVASHCWKTIIIMKHEGRRFVPKLDFLTSPGYLDGPGAREKAGLPRGTGPYRVVTSKGLFGFDGESRRMTLLSVLRGVPVREVLDGMGFRPLIAESVGEIAPPTEKELRVLREEIDPGRFIIRGERMTATT
jgi:glutaconate CoA-transferase subunit B